jgi:hypothetical protein
MCPSESGCCIAADQSLPDYKVEGEEFLLTATICPPFPPFPPLFPLFPPFWKRSQTLLLPHPSQGLSPLAVLPSMSMGSRRTLPTNPHLSLGTSPIAKSCLLFALTSCALVSKASLSVDEVCAKRRLCQPIRILTPNPLLYRLQFSKINV